MDNRTDVLAITSDALHVTCLPGNGFTILSLVDTASGADALWRRRIQSLTPGSRSLGASGSASVETFLDGFAGGWFTMFPEVGYPVEDDSTSMLHGEVVRLPWTVTEHSDTVLEAAVDTVRRPFFIRQRLEVHGPRLRLFERIEHVGMHPAPYSWGHHPCFSRATFAGGRIELEAASSHVPAPSFDPERARLEPGRPMCWPLSDAAAGGTMDVAAVPEDPDGRSDHVCVTPASGEARITAPRHGRALRMRWSLDTFPHVLIWQSYRPASGWPFWGDSDCFAIEFSTNPGRSTADAATAGAIRTLGPGEGLEAVSEMEWEPLGATASESQASSRARALGPRAM